MLVEVIIVTVVVVTVMTSLFVAFNRVYNAYDKKSKYVDIDGIYALKLLEDYMIDELMLNTLIKNNTSYTEIDCNEMGNDKFKAYCNSVFEEYNINNVYLVKELEELKNDVDNQTFVEYIEYLINVGVANDEKILFIIETYSIEGEEDNFNKYAYLPVKINES